MHKLSRRAILTGVGASLALPFMPSFRADSGSNILSVKAARADGTAPQRIVFWVNWFGTLQRYYTPKNTSADGTKWDLNEIMMPLAKYKDKMTVLTGINMVSIYDQLGRQGMHTIGNANMLSAAGHYDTFPYGPQAWQTPKGPSIDQVLVEKLQSPTPFRHLHVGDGSGHNNFYYMDSKGNAPTTTYWPSDVFDTVFKDYQATAADRARQRIEKASMLDAVLPAYKSLSNRVSARDKQVADAHLDAMRDLERRIKASTQCTPPQRPRAAVYNPAIDNVVYSDPRGPYDDHAELLARIMACDLTRVAGMTVEGTRAQPKALIPGFDAFIGSLDSHALTHASIDDVAGNDILKRFHIWRMTVMAKFCDILAATTDVDGRSMLDNTCVLNVSEIMTGLHDTIPLQKWGWSNIDDNRVLPEDRPKGMPYFYIGGLGGKLKTGLHLDFTKTDTYGDKLGKYAHGELFLTIARQMGIDATSLPTFGDPKCCKNLITEIMA